MIYYLDINDNSFLSIKCRRKRIEIRVTTDKKRIDYGCINESDEIIFSNTFCEKMKCLVTDVNWYKDIEELLVKEGTRYTLSGTDDFKKGVKEVKSIKNYEQGIIINGVYAIHLKLIE